MAYKKYIVPETVTEDTDSNGTVWTIVDSGRLPIEVWNEDDIDMVFIRQEGDGYVDLVSLSVGQAYDMLDVLSKALGVI